MFRLVKLIFMILLINDKIFCDETTNLPVDRRINLDDIDTGTLLSGFFDGEIVDGCPGQCIHTITSLFCPNVIENVTCASPLQKCCDFGNGSFIANQNKVAETVLPIEETTTLIPNYNSNEKQSTIQNLEKSKNTQINSSTTLSPLNSFTTNIVKKFTLKCSGECIDNQSSKYCANIFTNSGLCDDNQICCLKLNDKNLTTASISTSDSVIDLKMINTSPIPNTSNVQTTTIPTTITTPKSTQNKTNSSEKNFLTEDRDETLSTSVSSDSENSKTVSNKQSHNKNSDETMHTNLSECENCVAFIFTVLCDEIDNTKSCPSWGKCCVYYNDTNSAPNKTETTNTDSTTQTLTAQSSTANQAPIKCLGTCVPAFFSGICSKPTKILFNTDCARKKSICCYTPMPYEDQYNLTSMGYEKPSLLDYSDGLTYIEPSEQTLNNLNNYNNFNKLTTFKPPNYYQLVPRPNQSPPNLLSGLTSNWPFLNTNNNNHHHHQKIPIYKPLLSNSQMIPNPYLPPNIGLNNPRGGNSGTNGHAQILNTLNSLNSLNNLSPGPIYYPPATTSNNPLSSNNPSTANELFNTLNMYLSNNNQLSNNILPTIAPLKLNTTSNFINHLILTNKIPQYGCTGACMPSLFKFACFGSNNIIYTNFACAKPQQLCCASTNDVETYEQFILNNFVNNETSPINNLLHHLTNNNNNNNYINNLPVVVANSNSLPNLNNNNNNLNSNSLSNLHINNINKPLGNVNNLNTMKNNNLNIINKNKNQNYNMNKLRPLVNNNIPPDNKQPINPTIEKFTELNQPNIPAASNLNRYPVPIISNNNKNIPQINLNNKWSNSLSNLSSNHFSPSEKPLNHKPILNIDKPKKPVTSTIQPAEHFSVEIPNTSSKLPVCGLPGDENKSCWQVAITNGENQFISSGALIGNSWILTTASAISELVRNAKPLFVRVGDLTDLTSSNTFNSDSGQIQKVSTTYIHHNHNGETFENDIALLKLSSPVQLKSNVCLICLPARGSIVKSGKRCIATGYNLDSDSLLKIKESSVTILNEYQCSKKVNSLTNKGFVLPTSSFCTNSEDSNNCQFDEGGPLSCYVEDDYYELTGLMSYNFGCGNDKVPNIYVRVSLFINWINQIISVNNVYLK